VAAEFALQALQIMCRKLLKLTSSPSNHTWEAAEVELQALQTMCGKLLKLTSSPSNHTWEAAEVELQALQTMCGKLLKLNFKSFKPGDALRLCYRAQPADAMYAQRCPRRCL
jgi:hypothetical protein